MSNSEKGRNKIKQETSTQYKVTGPISMADLENELQKGLQKGNLGSKSMHTIKGLNKLQTIKFLEQTQFLCQT